MDVTTIAPAITAMTAARTQLDVGTAVLGRALEAASGAALQLISTMVPAPASVPPGLTFSPAGLSPGTATRHVWTL